MSASRIVSLLRRRRLGATVAPIAPGELANLAEWWDPAATYCQTDGAVDLEAGSSQYLSAASETALQTGDIDWTWMGWVKPESSTTDQYIASKYSGGNPEFGIQMNLGNAVKVLLGGGGWGIKITSLDTIADGANGLVCFEHDAAGDTVKLWIDNGTPVSVAHTDGMGTPGAGAFEIGSVLAGSSTWDGLQQSAAIWKRTLTAAEKTWLYNSGNGRTYSELGEVGDGSELKTDLVEWWNLHEKSGTRVGSHAGINLTAVNSPGVAAGLASGPIQNNSPRKSFTGRDASKVFAQSTFANQPIWLADADGAGNPGADFDGSNDTESVTTTVAQAFTLAAQVRFDAAGDYLFGGDVAGEFIGRGASDWESAWGSTLSGGTPDGDWHRLIAVVNGASSLIYIDGVQVASGDAGASGFAALVLGGKGDGSSPLDGRVRHVVLTSDALDADTVAGLDAWMAAN